LVYMGFYSESCTRFESWNNIRLADRNQLKAFSVSTFFYRNCWWSYSRISIFELRVAVYNVDEEIVQSFLFNAIDLIFINDAILKVFVEVCKKGVIF
jgi:hypothetical protein